MAVGHYIVTQLESIILKTIREQRLSFRTAEQLRYAVQVTAWFIDLLIEVECKTQTLEKLNHDWTYTMKMVEKLNNASNHETTPNADYIGKEKDEWR